ncbi:MAG: guanylate kinase [Clostridiales bacterium]|nr:guanylate kinase [Clostridiales bacterium]
MSRGILVVVSGFSGAGKGTVMKRLLEKYENYALSVSVTTRKRREEETEGKDYFFRSEEEFEELIRQGALIEHARYVDNYYGTPRAYVEEKLEAGRDVILEIEVQGASQVTDQYPEAVTVFVAAPTMEVLRQRLTGRGTETPEVIAQRMKRTWQEAQLIDCYDYILINDDLEKCVDTLHQIIQSEHLRTERNLELTLEIQKEAQKQDPEEENPLF